MKRPHVLAGAIVLACLLPLGPWLGHPPPEAMAQHVPQTESRASNLDDWWPTVQESILKSEYHVTWQEQTYLSTVPAAYQAPNRAHNLRTYFTAEGPIVIPRVWPEGSGAARWQWEVSLTGWGGEDAPTSVPDAVLFAEENRVEYQRAGLLEWYRNDEEGLVQGFTLQARQSRDQDPEQEGQPLRLDMRIAGDLSPWLDSDRGEIEFRTGDGETVLRCGPARATDADAQPLTTRLWLHDRALSLVVEDAGAPYPIQIAWTIAGLPPDHDWVQSGGGLTSQFGFSLATAGDVNGDGYSDVIVGAPYFDGGLTDEGLALVYPGWYSGLQNIPIWDKESGQEGAEFGHSVATAGDVNDDGFADIIVGAPRYDHSHDDEGAVWIYHGSGSGPHLSPDNFDVGNQPYADFGASVATAGDVNGDGFADVIVGAPCYSNGEGCEGRVWVWHGSGDGVSESHNWRAESNQDTAGMGRSVATAGDVNGDGFADVIVGAPYYNAPDPSEGAAFVWYGSGDGVNNDLNGDPTNAPWMVEGDQGTALMGHSVSTAGDVNGDGYADVIVGAPYYANGQTDEGAAWVYLGQEAGLSTTDVNQDEGNQVGCWFGYSVATAGDVNGDGYADIIVGAPHWSEGLSENGAAYLWYGNSEGVNSQRNRMGIGEHNDAWFGTSVATAGDVNGDGYSDVIVGAPGDLAKWGSAYSYYGSPSRMSDEASWTKASNKAQALFGFSVGTAGDVNGDGRADVIVGAPHWDGGHVAQGGAWVYRGKAGGLSYPPAWDKFGEKANDQFGWSVGTAGDVNGDGYSDVIVGAPTWNEGQPDEGMAFVYIGGMSGLLEPPNWSKDSGDEGAQFGYSVGTAGDVNGDGYSDVIVGSPFYLEDGKAWVYLGSKYGVEFAPHWHDDCDQDDSQFGASVGTAGDVNGDGYSDVIVGAPLWDQGEPNEGGAFVYHGSRTGLAKTPDWHEEGGMFNAQLGLAVGTAGDTDGDGFSDVIIGAPWASHGSDSEGIAWVYEGSSTGLDHSHLWRKESDKSGAFYGWSVGTAGDVNGDGYADVIVGAYNWSGGQPAELFEGGAWVYNGGSGGPHTVPDWHAESNQASAHFGYSAGSAGDVNGDGYADVIVGAPNYNRVLTDEGQAFVYFGNGASGVSVSAQQYSSAMRQIGPLGHSDKNRFRVSMLPLTPLGRGLLRFEIEAKPLGRRFDGTGTYMPLGSSGWVNPPPGAGIGGMSSGFLRPDTPYHWRIRTIYHPGTTPFLPASRWITVPWNGWNEQDLRTGGGLVLLPLVTRNYRAE